MVFKKGHTPWSKGKHLIEEHRVKIGLANKGKHLSEETREKISQARKGKKRSEETKVKISEFRKGKHVSPSTEFKKGYHSSLISEFKKGHPSWNKGKVFSLKTKKKLKEARAKQITPKKDTSIEVKIQSFLKQLGIEFFTHYYTKEISHAYQCDILIPQSKIIIECDGDYWHGNPIKYPIPSELQIRQQEKDKIRTRELQEKGFKVLRLWENDIKKFDIIKFQDILA